MLKNGGHHRWQTFSNDFSFLMIGKTRRICNIIESIFFSYGKAKKVTANEKTLSNRNLPGHHRPRTAHTS
jgi:hypothetical protein